MKCKRHPRYNAIRKPRVKCKACEFLYLRAKAEKRNSAFTRGIVALVARLLVKGGVLVRAESKPIEPVEAASE